MQTARQIVPEQVSPAAKTTAQPSKKAIWLGRIMSALPVLLLIFSATLKFIKPAGVVQGLEHAGIPLHLATPIGIIEIACALMYAIPRTAVLGAILVTGYMGGATLTHVRIGEPWVVEVLVGVFAWGGLYLRDPRIRELIPLRRTAR